MLKLDIYSFPKSCMKGILFSEILQGKSTSTFHYTKLLVPQPHLSPGNCFMAGRHKHIPLVVYRFRIQQISHESRSNTRKEG